MKTEVLGMVTKPLLLGMNNPLSDEPEFDLFPYPVGSTGWRLWKLLPEGTPRAYYMRAFDRRNLLRARAWSARDAREAAMALLPELDGRVVVVLGTEVRAALGLPPAEPLSRHTATGPRATFDWVALPHPSGRNYWYNNADNRSAAGAVLVGLMEGA